MDISVLGASNQTAKVCREVFAYIEGYERAKGYLPPAVSVKPKDWDALTKEAGTQQLKARGVPLKAWAA